MPTAYVELETLKHEFRQIDASVRSEADSQSLSFRKGRSKEKAALRNLTPALQMLSLRARSTTRVRSNASVGLVVGWSWLDSMTFSHPVALRTGASPTEIEDARYMQCNDGCEGVRAGSPSFKRHATNE